MIDSLITLLQWLLPTGSVGAVIVWLTSKTLRQARTAKEVHDTYKQMYDDLHDQLLTLSNENKHIRSSLSRLERAVTKGATCRLWSQCPIRSELQRAPRTDIDLPAPRQHQRKSRSPTDTRDPPRDEGDPEPPPLAPP